YFSPNEFSFPNTAICSFWKFELFISKTTNNSVSTARLLKCFKYSLNGAAYLLVRIENDVILIIMAKTDGKINFEFAFFRFILLPSLEARANKVKFCLGHCPL